MPKRPVAEEEKSTGSAADVKSVPAHLRTHSPADQTPTYEPQSLDRAPAGVVVVDTATFKPTFVRRAERETTQKTTKGDKRDGTSRGKDNKKRAAKAIVSFEEDEGAALVIAPQAADKDKDKSRKKKKRRKEKDSADAEGPGEVPEDAEMWVEKVPPQVVSSFATTSALPPPPKKEVQMIEGKPADPLSAESTSVQVAEGPSRGRKRAIDFL